MPHTRGERVAGVHHPLRLPGGPRGVADLDQLVRIDPPLVEERLRVDLVLPALGHQRRLEGVLALSPEHEHVLEVGELRAQALDHRLVLEPAEDARDEQGAGLGEREHELELARPEDRHQGVRHRADANAREVQGRELPPVGELKRHHVPLLDPVRGEARPDAAREPVDVAVREGGPRTGLGPVAGQEDLVRVAVEPIVQVVGGRAVRPVPGRGRRLDPLPAQHDAPIVVGTPARARRGHPHPSPCLADRRARPESVPPGGCEPGRGRERRREGRRRGRAALGRPRGRMEGGLRCGRPPVPARWRAQACWAAKRSRGRGSRIGQCSPAATTPRATATHHTMS